MPRSKQIAPVFMAKALGRSTGGQSFGNSEQIHCSRNPTNCKKCLATAEEATEELQNYVPEISKTTSMVQEIRLFSDEQNSALKSIRLEMDQLSAIAQRGIENLSNPNAYVPN